MTLVTWEGSLHLSFRFVSSGHPSRSQTPSLRVFLDSDGKTPDEVLQNLPYDQARSPRPSGTPDTRRYRDAKHIYQSLGLLYESSDNKVIVTDFGQTVRRWLDRTNEHNAPVLGKFAASALAGCQLRNPTRAGSKYDDSVSVFPYAYLWRAMLALEGRISSDELNRGLFKVTNEADLAQCIERVSESRLKDNLQLLGQETITGRRKNDRIIPWVALGSFGWMMISDKSEDDERKWYRIRPRFLQVLRDAAAVQHRHAEFATIQSYVEHLSRLAAAPPDLR